jgi:hypothetical protein
VRPGRALAALLVLASSASAASFGSPGTAGLDSSKILSSPRPAAMGGAGTALGKALSNIDLNPAALSDLVGPQAEAAHISWFEDIALDRVALAWGRGQGASLGLSYVQLGTPDVSAIDVNGVSQGSFHENDRSLALSAALPVGSLDLGVSLRASQRELAGLSETGFDGDLGARLRLGAGWSLGLSALHLGSLSALEKEADAAPSTVRGGLAWDHALGDDVEASVAVDGVQSVDAAVQVRAGAELRLYRVLSLRAGSQYSDAYDNRQAFTAGAGLHWNGIGIDYAYAPFGALGSTQRIGLSWTGNPLAQAHGPARPEWLEARRENGGAVLRWDGSGAPRWAVYLKRGQGEELSRVTEVSSAESQVRLRKVADNTDVVFAVAPVDPVEGEGPRSHQMTLAAGQAKRRVAAPLQAPRNLRVNKLKGHHVSWEAPEGAPNGTLYQAYVSNRPDAGFKPLGGLNSLTERNVDLGKPARRVYVSVRAQRPEAGALESEWSEKVAVEP